MCLVGSIGMTVQFITYNFIRHALSYSPFFASQLAVFLAIITNYCLHSKYTFKSAKKTGKNYKGLHISSFILYSLLTIYLQTYWLQLGINFVGKGIFQENGIIAVGLGLFSLLNYFIYSSYFWVKKSSVSSIDAKKS